MTVPNAPSGTAATAVAACLHLDGTAENKVVKVSGREFRVVPATLVRAQVLNNNLGRTLLPPTALTEAWAEQWNMAPVIIDHPTKRGHPISARDPDILNKAWVGHVFHARVTDEGELKADVYLALDRRGDVPELDIILDALDAGEKVELSTGFPVSLQEQAGVFNGEAYDVVMTPAGVDHLAVFTDKVGACSVEDGCGLGANCGCNGKGKRMGTMKVDVDASGLEKVADRLTALFRPLARLTGKEAEADSENESDEDRRQFLADSLRERFGGPAVHLWVQAVFSQEGRVVFARESEANGKVELLQTTFEVDDNENTVTFGDPQEVRAVTEFVPVGNEAPGHPNDHPENGEGDHMNREELIAQLTERAGLDADELGKLSDEGLQALQASYEKAPSAGDNGGDSAAAGSGEGGDPSPEAGAGAGDGAAAANAAAEAEALKEVLNGLKELREEIQKDREEIAALRDITRPAVEERERERAELVESLANNERVPYGKDELEAKGLEDLRKIRAMARGENYAGRGGPRAHQVEAEPQFAEPVPYWQQDADGAAAKQEVN